MTDMTDDEPVNDILAVFADDVPVAQRVGFIITAAAFLIKSCPAEWRGPVVSNACETLREMVCALSEPDDPA